MRIPQRLREIQQHGALFGESAKLRAQIHGDRGCSHAALGAHQHDQFFRRALLRLAFLDNASKFRAMPPAVTGLAMNSCTPERMASISKY